MRKEIKEIYERITKNPTCYLTGRKIDLSKSSSYHLDHIIPTSKGGPDTPDNCGLACRDANFAKNTLSLEEFKNLCVEVVQHFNLIENNYPYV